MGRATTDEHLSGIGLRLVEERRKLGITQRKLAAELGVTPPTQISYEQGLTSPNSGYLLLLDQLGFDIFYVLTGRRIAPAKSQDEQSLLALYRALDARGKAAAIGAMSGLAHPERMFEAGKHLQVVVEDGGADSGELRANTRREKTEAT